MITKIKWQKFNDIDSFDSENVFDGQAYFNGGAAAVMRDLLDDRWSYTTSKDDEMDSSDMREIHEQAIKDYAAANARAAATKAKNRGEDEKKTYRAKNKEYTKRYVAKRDEDYAGYESDRSEYRKGQRKEAAAKRATKKNAPATAPVKKTIAKKAPATRKKDVAPAQTLAAQPKGTKKKPAAKKVPAKTSKKSKVVTKQKAMTAAERYYQSWSPEQKAQAYREAVENYNDTIKHPGEYEPEMRRTFKKMMEQYGKDAFGRGYVQKYNGRKAVAYDAK